MGGQDTGVPQGRSSSLLPIARNPQLTGNKMDGFATLNEAFTNAGFVPSEPREVTLRRMMREAIETGRGMAVSSQGHFLAALNEEDDAAGLLWELFSSVRGAVIGALFTDVLNEMRAEGLALRNVGEASEALPNGQRTIAEPTPHAETEAGSGTPNGHMRNASVSAPQRPSWQERAERHRKLWEGRLADDINGKPLGECTAGQVRSYARDMERQGRYRMIYANFLKMVVGEAPDERKIGDLHDAESTEKLYRFAELAEQRADGARHAA